MTTQSQPDPHPAQVGVNTERAVRDLVSSAVSRLSEALKDQEPEWEIDSQWKRGDDGHFREHHTERTRILWSILNEKWLHSLPEYNACVERLTADAAIGPHLGRLVGTSFSAMRLDPDNVLWSAIYGILDDGDAIGYTDERFDRSWQELVDFFCADQILLKTVAPLPRLVIVDFPLRLNNELVLDRLTEDEVTRCCQVGLLRPDWQRFPLIDSDVAVGIRRTVSTPKRIGTGDEPPDLTGAQAEGSFGSRPSRRDDLVVDDVLSTLRLFKHSPVHTAGHASWSDSFWLRGGTSYRVLGQPPYSGKYELSEGEVPQFLELWYLLQEGAAHFSFSIHRFNLAFDRGLVADRMVDLVIAAESLFLGDLGVQDRGELRFRFALRAAKFIEHPVYAQRDVYRVMRLAYDARSAIVHGGSPKDTSLPDNESATFPTFIDAVEELVRLGLRKGLSMKKDGKKLRQAEYWDDLVLSKPDIVPNPLG